MQSTPSTPTLHRIEDLPFGSGTATPVLDVLNPPPLPAGYHGAQGAAERRQAASLAVRECAPLVVKINVCNGLTNQRIALVDGIVIGLLLGAQIALPDAVPLDGVQFMGSDVNRKMAPLSRMYDMAKLTATVRALYTDYWCDKSRRGKDTILAWCSAHERPVFVHKASASVIRAFNVTSHTEPERVKLFTVDADVRFDGDKLELLRRSLLKQIAWLGSEGRGFMNLGCTLFRLLVSEADTDVWRLFWSVDDALEYTGSIAAAARRIVSGVNRFGAQALRLAMLHGHDRLDNTSLRGFNVLHLRAEEDWLRHCKDWMGLDDGVHRDNCVNNTMSVAGALVSEGLDPRLPLYVCTGLSRAQLLALEVPGQYGGGFAQLTKTFTVVTKEDLMAEADMRLMGREELAAVEFIVASRAETFVGNSVSTFSAFLLIR